MKHLEIPDKESKLLYLLKFFAIFSVICAHIAVPSGDNKEGLVYIVIRFLSATGTMGVPLFYIISGYLFYGNSKRIDEFWKNKLVTIIMSWMFCETIVWLYVVLRKGGISLGEWIKFILGVYHSTYYLTVLIILFVVYFKLKKYKVFLIASVIISAISLIALGSGCVVWQEINKLTITPYLNPLNWMIYFSIGLIIRKNNCLERLADYAFKGLIITVPALIVSFGIHHVYQIPWLYYSKYALLNIFLQIAVAYGGAEFIARYIKKSTMLEQVGKQSFTIYLLHELVVGAIVYLTGLTNNALIIFLRPFIVVVMVMIGIEILYRINEKCNMRLNIFLKLIGLREKR